MSESTNPRSLAIQALILDRCRALGLSRSELVRRAGFKNVAKGIRRLDELCGGELQKTEWLMKGLPSALELAPHRVADALRETEKQLAEIKRRADAERRASFHPSAYLLGTETRPTQLTIYGISGGPERWLRIPLDLSQPAVTFVKQALLWFVRHQWSGFTAQQLDSWSTTRPTGPLGSTSQEIQSRCSIGHMSRGGSRWS